MTSFDPIPTVIGTASNGIVIQAALPPADAFEQHPYRDLVGHIKRDSTSIFPAHGGGYSDVYIGYYTREGKTTKVAIKVLRMSSDPTDVERIRRHLNRETYVWHRLCHPNILEFLGLASDLGRWNCPALISPYCDNETLPNYLKRHPDVDPMSMIRGVALGLEYLHRMDVIHGDLKPSNVLVDDFGKPLLCDFGRSKIVNQRGFTTRPAGACRYQAVELLDPDSGNASGPTKASDVYAFGLSCYEIWTGRQPYHDIGNDTYIIINVVMHDARPAYPSSPRSGTEYFWPILEACWVTEPSKRPTAEGVVQSLGARN